METTHHQQLVKVNKNLKRVYQLTKRRFSQMDTMIQSTIPALITGELTVTAENLEAFLSTAKSFFTSIELTSKKIAVRLLDALCQYEYDRKDVKNNRRLPDSERKRIICEELRADEKFRTRIERWPDVKVLDLYTTYFAVQANNNLAHIKKHESALRSMLEECTA
ncbi:hypothetical protein ADUPG1_007276, partial [Aduncisulcus paluster]